MIRWSLASIRPTLAVVTAAIAALPTVGLGQTSTDLTACTTGALSNCALIQLRSELGVGLGGTNLFELAIRNLGSTTTPSLATSLYNFVFLTTQPPAEPGTEVDAPVLPAAGGGATVVDASPWSLFDSGDAIFLSALGGNGVGGCAPGTTVDGFGQAGQTCGEGQFFTFSFFTSRSYDPAALTLANMEVVGLTIGLPGDSCGADDAPCAITRSPVTVTPEPGTLLLSLTGLCGLVGVVRRRRVVSARGPVPMEVIV